MKLFPSTFGLFWFAVSCTSLAHSLHQTDQCKQLKCASLKYEVAQFWTSGDSCSWADTQLSVIFGAAGLYAVTQITKQSCIHCLLRICLANICLPIFLKSWGLHTKKKNQTKQPTPKLRCKLMLTFLQGSSSVSVTSRFSPLLLADYPTFFLFPFTTTCEGK